jgi:acetoin utilization protein AcuB
MEIAAIMQTEVVSIRSNATVRDAILLLEDWHIRHLPVVDGGRLVGMVSDRDLRDYRLPLADEIDDPEYADEMLTRTVAELMSEDVVTLDPEDSIKAAVEAMINDRLGAVPVVSSGDDMVVGIVSYIDILRLFRDTL